MPIGNDQVRLLLEEGLDVAAQIARVDAAAELLLELGDDVLFVFGLFQLLMRRSTRKKETNRSRMLLKCWERNSNVSRVAEMDHYLFQRLFLSTFQSILVVPSPPEVKLHSKKERKKHPR